MIGWHHALVYTVCMKKKALSVVAIVVLLSVVWMVYTFLSAVVWFESEIHEDPPPPLPSPGFVQTNLGSWTEETFLSVLPEVVHRFDVGEQIDVISEKFLGTPYEANTLVGDIETPEEFTVHLAGLDCFTYLDYVEAARLSDSYDTFLTVLQLTRYRYGVVEFGYRNHFFSDWVEYNRSHVSDVTKEVGGDAAVAVEKQLNQKKDGGVFLEGIPIVTRTITHIPTAAVTDEVVGRLRTGDYIGIYTDIDGLDVTHTGIFIRNDSGTYLRHASSREGAKKVIDDDFLTYLKNTPGITVYRPY